MTDAEVEAAVNRWANDMAAMTEDQRAHAFYLLERRYCSSCGREQTLRPDGGGWCQCTNDE